MKGDRTLNNILKTIEIDVCSPTCYEVVKAQQGDKNSRNIEFILYTDGTPYEITDDLMIRFTGHRGNGSTFIKNDCCSVEANRITVTLDDDILYYAGIIEAKLVLYDIPKHFVLSTVPFQIICVKSPCHESELAPMERSVITDLLFEAEAFSKSASDTIRQAKESADTAVSSANAAKNSMEAAAGYNTACASYSSNAQTCADTAVSKANEAASGAKTARSYACGDTNLRPNETSDNAKYYYTQSKAIYDDFTQSGAVLGVKGNAQSNYQTGFVNLTPGHIGALSSSAQTTINNSYHQANSAYRQANAAYNQANAAYNQANMIYREINDENLCLGYNAARSGSYTTIIGSHAYAGGNHPTALGYGAYAGDFEATALGSRANAATLYSTAVGTIAKAISNHSVAVGYNANANGDSSIAIGHNSRTLGHECTALGTSAYASDINSIAIGNNAAARNNNAIAVGHNTFADEQNSLALGYNASSGKQYSMALGYNAYIYAHNAIALGSHTSIAFGNYSTALGYAAATANTNSIQLGNASTLSSITARVSITPQSDMRDKTDIEDISNGAIDFLNKVRAVRYVFNSRDMYIDKENLSKEEQEKKAKFGLCAYDKDAHAAGEKKGSRKRIGVLAQEVQHALEETYGNSSYVNLVNDNLFDFSPEEIPDGVESQLAVNYEGFIPFLIKAVQELDARIRALEAAPKQTILPEETPHE